MKHVLLVRYGEIHLKGLNRPYFKHALERELRRMVSSVEGIKVWEAEGRFYIGNYPVELEELLVKSVAKVCGVHSVSPAWAVEKDLAVMGATVVEMLRQSGQTEKTFKVEARRSDKRFPMNSMQLAAEMGGLILDSLPQMVVDIHNPQVEVGCEVREEVYLYVEKIPGVGGMPVGTAGRAALLLSGGIDSPVAGYMMAKRGVELEGVYFHSFPHTSERAKQKVVDLAQVLTDYCDQFALHVVPFTAVQEYLYDEGPDALLTLLMRRSMMRISAAIAQKTGCLALATGETIGQVASQTMEALAVTNPVAGMPVFRPLICFDKMETVEIARRIGTYDISILPYEDCCTVFTPRHPCTKPKLDKIMEAEAALPRLAELEAEAVSGVEVIRLHRKSLV